MQAQLVLSLPTLREGKFTATNQMRLLAAVQAKHWEAILSLQGAREGGVGALTELGAKKTASNGILIPANNIVSIYQPFTRPSTTDKSLHESSASENAPQQQVYFS